MDNNVIGTAHVNFRGVMEAIDLISENDVVFPRYKEICLDESGEICIFFDKETEEYVGVKYGTPE